MLEAVLSALRAAHRKLEWRDAIILAVAIRTIYPSAYRFAIKLAAMRGLTEWSERRGAQRHTHAEHIADEAAAREARGLAPHAIPGPYRGG